MDKQAATKLIAEKLAAVNTLITEAEKIADEADVSFHLNGPAYGMGGSYTGRPEGWSQSTADCEGTDAGWSASSQSC